MRNTPLSTLLSFLLASLTLLACGGGTDPMTPDGGMDDATSGRAVMASAFCDELSAMVCTVNTRCCGGIVGGEDETCEEQQLAACESSVAMLLSDPRTQYVPERGGAFLDALEVQAAGCFVDAPRLEDFLEVFAGTGAAEADCTPPDVSDDVGLRVSQLSCADGLACHLYRRSDGSTLGVCEARTDGDCSHRFDCAAGQWCNLPGAWEPGRWGRCQPLKAEGWTCAGDLECASRFCDRTGTCAAPDPERYCAALTYEGTVLSHEPVGYWRLGEGSGSAADASGAGLAGDYRGSPMRTEGALAADDDGAMALDDATDAVSIPGLGAALTGDALTLEAWFRRTEGSATGPLLEFADDETLGVRVWNHDAADKVHVNFTDGEMNFSTTSAEGLIAADTWYHVVATYDGAVGRVYVDGQRVGDEVTGSGSLQTAGDLHIGIREEDERHLVGAIDEVAVYDRALSRAEILRHTALGKDGPSPQDFVLFRWLR